jgi:hypothetical protein
MAAAVAAAAAAVPVLVAFLLPVGVFDPASSLSWSYLSVREKAGSRFISLSAGRIVGIFQFYIRCITIDNLLLKTDSGAGFHNER